MINSRSSVRVCVSLKFSLPFSLGSATQHKLFFVPVGFHVGPLVDDTPNLTAIEENLWARDLDYSSITRRPLSHVPLFLSHSILAIFWVPPPPSSSPLSPSPTFSVLFRFIFTTSTQLFNRFSVSLFCSCRNLFLLCLYTLFSCKSFDFF